MKIVFLGSSQKKHIADLLSRAGCTCIMLSEEANAVKRKVLNLCRFLSADMVYSVGGEDYETCYVYKLARLLGKKVVIHWIGTDVLNAVQNDDGRKRDNSPLVINLAGSELLQTELEQIGICASVVPIVPCNIEFDVCPMPSRHAVLSYIPQNRESFYGMEILKKVAKEFPDIQFHIVSNNGLNDTERLENVVYEGMLNPKQMKELYKNCSVLFRYPQHDGLSMMVLEALGMGRTVIYKYPFPYVVTPEGETIQEILQTFSMVFSENPKVNQAAAQYVRDSFSVKKQLNRYRKAGVL